LVSTSQAGTDCRGPVGGLLSQALDHAPGGQSFIRKLAMVGTSNPSRA